MNSKKQLSIQEFSRLTGIKRENLRFYDRIGLLCPEHRGENNYRYYSRHQLGTAYLVGTLRGLGVGIEEIKQYSSLRTPEKSLELLAQHQRRIEEELLLLQQNHTLVQLYTALAQDALAHGQNDIFLEERPPEPIFLCPPIPPGMDEDEGSVFSYEYAASAGIHLGSPQGVIIPQSSLARGDSSQVERYYFKAIAGGDGMKPPGLYAVAYGQCDPWNSQPLYQQLLAAISAQGLAICGDAYEECPLADLATPDPARYCLRIEVPVRPKP